MRRLALAPLALCVVVAGSTPATTAALVAQAESNRPATKKIDEGELRAYASAKHKVDELAREWVPKLEGADAQQRQSLRQQFASELLNRVRAAGLSMTRYSEIQAAEQRDAALRTRIARYSENTK